MAQKKNSKKFPSVLLFVAGVSLIAIVALVALLKNGPVAMQAAGTFELFSDNFNSASSTSNWILTYLKNPGSQNIIGDAKTTTVEAYEGASLILDDRAAALKPISTKGYENISVSYCRRAKLALPFNYLRVGWKLTTTQAADWSGWNELDRVPWYNFIWYCSTFNLPTTANNSSIELAFFGDEIEGNYGLVDNVVVSGTKILPADGSITIMKESAPVDPQSFLFYGPQGNFYLNDDGANSNKVIFNNLASGYYTYQEQKTSGWNLTDIVCNSTSTSIMMASSSVMVKLNSGQKIACMFKNTKTSTATSTAKGSITIIKNSIPDDPQAFLFSGPKGSFYLSDIGSSTNQNGTSTGSNMRTDSNLAPGNYTYQEQSTAGWNLNNISCNGVPIAWSSAVTVKLNGGENVACTFTNTK
jgi:hypothetical protein